MKTGIMFVCLGNICRSPTAEFIFKDMIKKHVLSRQYEVCSAGTSGEEEGNFLHPLAAAKLDEMKIPYAPRRAVVLKKSDYGSYDYFIGMDEGNVRYMRRLFSGDGEGKVYKLLDFTDTPRDVADPWYTGNFDTAFDDIEYGLKGLLNYLEKVNKEI